MEELIAKRYVKALIESAQLDELKEIERYLEAMASLFKDWKIKEIIISPEIKSDEKLELLIGGLENPNIKFVNLMRVLAAKRRLSLIPLLAKELKSQLAFMQKSFEGKVFSEFDLSSDEIEEIEKALANRLGAEIKLTQAPQKYDGIKVEVDTIGIEIEFSKSKIKKQLIDNILKAI
ncbi:F0F1 ATP synthase subunit delta [Nitratiruptor tergarcus]|uniref:ATP synthase subunit delta n=1 Tax=Nitratiruptor tergarcus DSM 16512 TaxID=1069081 RepID=A0A1W1WUF0_9BACT|nr:F0F1 ATP synthase subunit delta [Nitratiruptor tergarcus]SMC09941.1 F-type H+-transporting ATPase subunit delta [Nitratiruptor tergarcus DSM 16512]